MKQDLGLCFKIARENSGFTQEYAAELLEVSTTTIVNYEGNKIKNHDESLICKMMNLYKARWIGYAFLQKSQVGMLILPEIDICDLANGVLHFQKETRDLKSVEYDMIDIAADGKIDESEKTRWTNVVKEIMDVCASSLTLALATDKGGIN